MAIDNQDVRWFVALGVLMLLVFAYIYMPRYDVRTLGDEQFGEHRRDRPLDRADSACRATTTTGKLHVSDVYVPF